MKKLVATLIMMAALGSPSDHCRHNFHLDKNFYEYNSRVCVREICRKCRTNRVHYIEQTQPVPAGEFDGIVIDYIH